MITSPMIERPFWKNQLIQTWEHRSVIWVSGVRRVGKTSLCQTLNAEYFDCELPRVRHLFADPEALLHKLKGKRVIFDEIQRLENPSEILKIAADHYPDVKIVATGSSILGASTKFGDTLTGRKAELWLTPLLVEELEQFGNADLQHRFLYGGLPPFFLSPMLPEKDFSEWLDSFWAKDIQELFRLEKRYSFQKLVELLFAQSGAIFEATRFAKLCEISRATVNNYLAILESTFAVHIIRPFSSHRPTEIVSAPKVFGFDTGFVCHNRGWLELQRENLGLLWEHIVLNELQGQLQTRDIHYWRDKAGHEIDFIILKKRNHDPIAIECKWSAKNSDMTNLQIFRRIYPKGKSYVVCPDIDFPLEKKYGELAITFTGLKDLIADLKS